MAALPRCSECPEALVYPDGHTRAGKPKPAGTKTCSDNCRNKRSRRKARQARERGEAAHGPPELKDIAAAVRGQTTDVAHEVIADELRPIVREAMTADVLRSIDRMVKLTPAAIAVLQIQLESSDETVAQRAATLLLKYTLGNPSVAPPSQEHAPAPMSVTFNIPRPGDITSGRNELEGEELRQCTDCGTSKQPDEFVGASDRCTECFDGLHETLRQRFAKVDPTAPSK